MRKASPKGSEVVVAIIFQDGLGGNNLLDLVKLSNCIATLDDGQLYATLRDIHLGD